MKSLKGWIAKVNPFDPHIGNIMKAALSEVRKTYGIEKSSIQSIEQSPPRMMKDLPRNGDAWFVTLPYPEFLRSTLVVEVDDATETVTRVWSPPA